jgi:hypothetical protein
MKIIQTITHSLILLFALSSLGLAQDGTFQVIPDSELGAYRLSYLNPGEAPFTVSITDADGNLLHRERLNQQNKLARAYRFSDVEAGTYFFQISTPEKSMREAVEYPISRPAQLMAFTLLTAPGSDRYQLQLAGESSQKVTVRIYDQDGSLLYNQRSTVAEQSNQVYNLAQVGARSVTFSVSNDEESFTEQVTLR